MNKAIRVHNLYQKVARLRWLAPIVVVSLAALHQAILWSIQPWLPAEYRDWVAVALYGLSGSIVVWLTLGWLSRRIAWQEQTEAELRAAHQSLQETYQQLLTVHDIGREIASASEMQQVLELATRAPTYVAGAKGATLITVDDQQGRLKLDMAWGLSDAYLDRLRQRMEAGLPSEQCLTCKPLTAQVGGNCVLFGGMDDLVQQEGIRSLICLPITRNQKCEGFINAYFSSPDGPPQEQLQLLNIVATEIATALDSIRLRSNQKATLYVIENLAQPKHELDDLLRQVLDITLSGWGVQEGGILLYNAEDKTWHHWTHRGLGDSPDHPRFELALQLAESVRQQGYPLLIPNLPNSVFHSDEFGSVAVAPLMIGQSLLGVLMMATPQSNFFHPHQTPFLTAIAHQATLAISNAQLHTRIQQVAILEERYRLSREIHDGLAQTLSMLGWHLDLLKTLLQKQDFERLAEEIARGQQIAREAYMDVREAIEGLRIKGDGPNNLVTTLQQYLADFEARAGIPATLNVDAQQIVLPAETTLQLLRIVQEALSNVRKHANARQVWVQVRQRISEPALTLTISDDGDGFDPALPRGHRHLGMSTMRERAHSLKGDISIITGPGQGTRIMVTIPVRRQPEREATPK